MSAARRGAITAAVLGLTLALGSCAGAGPSAGSDPEATAPAVATDRSTGPGSSPTDLLRSPSAPPQGIVTSSTFAVGDLVACTVTRVSPMLVLLKTQDRIGVIRGAAYEKVKVGDRVTVQITQPDGRFEATLVHVANRS